MLGRVVWVSAAAWAVCGISFSGEFSTFCATQASGQVYCWGNNQYGNLGVSSSVLFSAFPVQLPGVTNASFVHGGMLRTCVVDVGGEAKCTGKAYLGDGTALDAYGLVRVKDGNRVAVKVFAGDGPSCVLSKSGGVRCWGANHFGGLGDGTTTTRLRPVPVLGFETSGVLDVGMGFYHICLLTVVGRVRCAGQNLYGQLGSNMPISSSVVSKPVGNPKIVTSVVACGGWHCCALSTSNGVGCWGFDKFGQLGQGIPTGYSQVPVQPNGFGPGAVVDIQLGAFTTIAIMAANRTVMYCGTGGYGGLGAIGHYTPTLLSAKLTGVQEVRGGFMTVCVISRVGRVLCAGADGYGQLGRGLPLGDSLSLGPVVGLPATRAPTANPSSTKYPTRRPSRRRTRHPTRRPSSRYPTTSIYPSQSG